MGRNSNINASFSNCLCPSPTNKLQSVKGAQTGDWLLHAGRQRSPVPAALVRRTFSFRTGTAAACRPCCFKQLRRNLTAQPQHLCCNCPDFPLRPIAATKPEKVSQTAHIHGHNHFCFTGIRQHIPCIFNGFLFCFGASCFSLQPAARNSG